MKLLSLPILTTLLIFLPAFPFAQDNTIEINISLTGMPDNDLFYLYSDGKIIDSTLSKNAVLKYSYHKQDSKPTGLAVISSTDHKYGYFFFVENNSITLTGKYGSKEQLNTLNSKTQNEFKEYMDLTSSITDSIALKEAKMSFFKKHPNSMISTMNLFFDATKHKFTKEEILQAFKLLSPEQQNSSEGNGILKSVMLYQEPKIGQAAPDFHMQDETGKDVSLFSFQGKNIVLIFWASWCVPCIQEMQEIRKAYEILKGKNYIFIAVSVDEKKENWLKGVKTNTQQFINLTDLKGWSNEAALTYGVSSVPNLFLIDPAGKLVAHEHWFNKMNKHLANYP